MERIDIYGLFGLGAVIIIFLWENRRVSGEDKIFLWILLGVMIVLFFFVNIYLFLKSRLDIVEENKKEILKLKDQISFRKSLEEINYKIGKLEMEVGKHAQKRGNPTR